MKTKKHLARWLALMLVLLITGSNAIAQGPGGEPFDTPTQIVCPGETQPYAVYPGDAGNTFLWTITPGTDGIEWSILSGQGTPSIQVDWANPVAPTVYTVTLRETNPGDGCYTEVSVAVTVNPAPAPVITGLDVVCEGQTGVTYSTPNVPGNTYSWVVTGGNITAGDGTNEITVTWTTPGTGSVELTESVAATGCSVTVTLPVTVNPLPAPVITGLDVVCEGQTGVTYSTPNVPGNTYSWVVTGGNITAGAGTNEITVTWTTPGAGSVELTESVAATGCSVTVTLPVTVNPLPAPVITGLDVVCEGQTGVTYSTPNVPGNTYSWVVTGGNITAGAGTNEITVTWTTPGAGSVELTESVAATGCSVTVTLPVTINPRPTTSPIWHN